VDVNGGLYPGFRANEEKATFYLMGAEADVTARYSSKTRDLAIAAVQLWMPSPMPDWTMGFHFGQAYALIPLGLRRPTIRVGQAVIPFGLLADYDTHGQIVQTQYARTLSQRIDLGLGLLGDWGRVGYALWVSNGAGPYRLDADQNKVVTVRVAPKFLLGDAELTLGLSGLAGRLPHWYQSSDSTESMTGDPPDPVIKYRLALDNTTDLGPLTLRLEGVAGKDSALSEPLVYGYYAEARYAFVSWLEALGKYDDFYTTVQSARNLSAGLTFYPSELSAMNLQVVLERNYRDGKADREYHQSDWDVAAQLAVRF
jgi:hypothetical protein